METFEDFRSGVFRFVENKPKAWRDGQAVFNYINDTYGVARDVQFGKNVDCFFDDNKIEDFIREAYDIYVEFNYENYNIENENNIILTLKELMNKKCVAMVAEDNSICKKKGGCDGHCPYFVEALNNISNIK
jgi:hypothetical protein